MARLPWYAFLYRLFGAQGTFWLWVLCVIALWWTATPTLHRLTNLKPTPGLGVAAVATQAATSPTRWVELQGVEVTYDAELVGQDAPSGHTPVRLLLDPENDAARWWARTRELADAAEAGDADARKALVDRFASLDGKARLAHPIPEQSLVVQNNGSHPARSTPFPPAPADPLRWLEWQEARFRARAARVREQVRPDAVIKGLLVPVPETLAARIRDQHGITVGRWVLQEGKEPRELESWIFAAAAILLVFLATGFYGAVRAQPPPVDAV